MKLILNTVLLLSSKRMVDILAETDIASKIKLNCLNVAKLVDLPLMPLQKPGIT